MEWNLNESTRSLPPNITTGRKEMFYLTTHSTHFILRLYGVGHMVKDHLDSERGNPLPPHGLLFPISSKGSFMEGNVLFNDTLPLSYVPLSKLSKNNGMNVEWNLNESTRSLPPNITTVTVFISY